MIGLFGVLPSTLGAVVNSVAQIEASRAHSEHIRRSMEENQMGMLFHRPTTYTTAYESEVIVQQIKALESLSPWYTRISLFKIILFLAGLTFTCVQIYQQLPTHSPAFTQGRFF